MKPKKMIDESFSIAFIIVGWRLWLSVAASGLELKPRIK